MEVREGHDGRGEAVVEIGEFGAKAKLLRLVSVATFRFDHKFWPTKSRIERDLKKMLGKQSIKL